MGSKFVKFLGFLVFLAVIVLVSAKLFFETEFTSFVNQVRQYVAPQVQQKVVEKELNVAFASDVSVLDPTLTDLASRQRLLQIYEPLISPDRDLRMKPAIAISWGRVDDTTWEFRMRPDVKFHNGKGVTADDVVASFRRAQQFEKSQLESLLAGISVRKEDSLRIRMKTVLPDPLLPSKISTVFIFPEELENEETIVPTGTGPYQFVSFIPGREMRFSRFDDYYGEKPAYKNVIFKVIPDKEARKSALLRGEIQLLADVPPQFVRESKAEKIEIKTMPSLQVSSLMFNFNSPVFAQLPLRQAVTKALDKKEFVKFAEGFAGEANQFVSSGVYGFDPEIPPSSYDVEGARKMILEAYPFEKPKVQVDLPEGLTILGDYIEQQFTNIGLVPTIQYFSPLELEKRIQERKSELYFLGWHSEFGDVGDFYQAVAHSPRASYGTFNGGNYASEKVDRLIEESLQTLDPQKRLQMLREIMKIIAEEDVIGVPLFESQVIYAIRSNVNFTPRVDGYLIVSEIS